MNVEPLTSAFLVPACEDRARLAWLAGKRQELLGPASALLDLSDVLLRDAEERGLEPFIVDQRKVRNSAGRLIALIDDVLAPDNLSAAKTDLDRRIRHDLRTPLAEVLGICELWLEDAPEQLLEGYLADLGQIHGLARDLLGRLDDLLTFGKAGGNATYQPADAGRSPHQGEAEIIEAVLEDLPPPLEGPAAAREVGAILVVEDNPINRDVLARRLRRDGHQVTLAENGKRALDLLAQQDFDVVLLDIIMPELNGLQVLQRLKAEPRWHNVRVVMISAFPELDAVVHCLEMGADDYLPKPCNPVLLKARIGACLEKKRLRDREARHLAEIERERQRADDLLHVILPTEVVRELKDTNNVQPRRFEDVAVLFADIVGFTPYCDRSRPEEVVTYLQQLVEAWEEIALRHRVQKIKTIGDAFMAAAGLLQLAECPVLNCLHCGLDMIAACHALPINWNVRVGIHVGPVVAGVIGRRQYLFDLWGDTVNTAARMESQGVAGAVTLSGAAWQRVAGCCRGESRGEVAIKGKGAMEMFRFHEFTETSAPRR
jgi:adenylate cyclase